MVKRVRILMLVMIVSVLNLYGKDVVITLDNTECKAGETVVFGDKEELESIYEATVEKRPFLSESIPVITGGKVKMDTDVAGKYEIKIVTTDGELGYSVNALNDTDKKADELFKIIKTNSGLGDFKGTEEAVKILKRNYPQSRYFPDAFYLTADSAEKSGSIS